jgi:predicted RNA methylase
MVMFTRFAFAVVSAGLFLQNVGCASSAHLDLSASRLLLTIATEMRMTVEEYHADLAQLDEQREAFAIQSFIARVADADRDKAKLEKDGATLSAALAKLRADRAVAVERYIIALGNIDLLAETAEGLKSHALARLRLGQGVLKVLANEE